MKQPQRTQPSRTARSGPNALSLTSPQSAPCDVPQVLERSTRSLADVKKCTGDVTGPGVLVKLYLVGDLWIVGSPHTKKWTPSKVEDMRTANATAKANDRTKASHPAKSRPSSAHEAKAQLNSDEVVTQKKRRSRGRGEGKATGQQVHKDQDESDDMSDETEGEEDAGEEDVGDEIAGKEDAWKQNTGEGDAGKGDAAEENEEEEGDVEEEDVEEEDAGGEDVAEEDGGEDNDAEEQAARKQDAGENSEENSSDPEKEGDLEDGPERNSVVIEENGHDAEEEEEDGHNKVSKDTGTKAADKRVDEDYEGEEGYAETNGKEGELEAKGQPEAEREGERESGEKTSEETEPSSEAGGKDRAVHDGEEEEERCTNAAKETNTVEEGSESTEENKKRASADSISEEHPNKRHKSGRDRNGVGTTTVDSLDRTIGLNAQLRPQTPPAKSTTPSTPSTIEVVRQTSVVPGLEDTECAVWDAALRDSIVNSLPLEQQARMIHAALSLGSKAGIDALRHFVENARKEGKRRRENLQSGFQPDVPHFGVEVWHATGTMISRDRSLAHFSDLYRRIDILDNKVVTFSIAKRVQLAALAEYRKSLLQEGAGRNQAKDINLHLFHTVYPDHAIVRDPDAKGTSSAARRDWNRLCNRLREGRMWFEVRHLFGGVGAFLALPPQCVSDRHLYRMPAATFSSWLRLLEVAWRALNTHARHTLNDLVRMSLVGQPLPDGLLALETLENGPGTAPASLSDILTGWSLFERKSQDDEGESSPMTHCEKDGNRAAIGPPSTTASSTNTLGKIDPGSCSREVSDVDDGLLNDLEFDDGLSQEI